MEVVAPAPLLDARARLAQPGWARRPWWAWDPAALSPARRRWRLKEWDFYGIATRDDYLALVVAHVGYFDLVAAQWIALGDGRMVAERWSTTLARGCPLPRSSASGDVRLARGGVTVELVRRPGGRTLHADWKGLTLALELDHPDARDGIVMATPIGADGFYYNHKLPAMPVRGHAAVPGRRLDLDGALAVLDWGRGVWPYRTYWNWATGGGRLGDGRLFGLNLGAGFGDLSGGTENCFFLDGRIQKLDEIDFEYDRYDDSKPWRFRDRHGRLDLTLTPRHVQRRRFELLVVASRVQQPIGAFHGWVVDDHGTRIAIDDAAAVWGWAEEHRARW